MLGKHFTHTFAVCVFKATHVTRCIYYYLQYDNSDFLFIGRRTYFKSTLSHSVITNKLGRLSEILTNVFIREKHYFLKLSSVTKLVKLSLHVEDAPSTRSFVVSKALLFGGASVGPG